MSSKEEILAKIKQNTGRQFPMPDLSKIRHEAIRYDNKLERFCQSVGEAGGHAVVLGEGDDLNEVIKKQYPAAKRIASVIPEITCATYNPDSLESPKELDGTDLAVIQGELGVAENGAVWIQHHSRHRALYFISENLVLLLDRNAIVDNMHEAYLDERVNTGEGGFGVFISGPSKTADIEQALVKGAHGARDVTVILV